MYLDTLRIRRSGLAPFSTNSCRPFDLFEVCCLWDFGALDSALVSWDSDTFLDRQFLAGQGDQICKYSGAVCVVGDVTRDSFLTG